MTGEGAVAETPAEPEGSRMKERVTFAASMTALCCPTRSPPTSLPEISSTRSPAANTPWRLPGAL